MTQINATTRIGGHDPAWHADFLDPRFGTTGHYGNGARLQMARGFG
jgi:hypothetical protein